MCMFIVSSRFNYMYVCHLFYIRFSSDYQKKLVEFTCMINFCMIMHNFLCTVMELNDKLRQVETQMTMCSSNNAVTVALGVLLGVAIVIISIMIIVLVVLLCRLKPCRSQNQGIKWMCH